MSPILKNTALAAVSRSKPSAYYTRDNRPNPVLQVLDQRLKLFYGYMKNMTAPGYKRSENEPYSRPADMLFELWNTHQPRLPELYYEEKLLEVGDFLLSIKKYNLALWQCYERYLQRFGDVNVEEISDVDSFRSTFFPSGFQSENAGLTFRALMGKSISMYQMVKLSDPKLQNKQSIEKCIQILFFLRIVTQVVLPKEMLCWLVYNGTVHIYSISRHLMTLGHSARALEYLLWASMCMETSVPLLGGKYISWRATLYTAVCQCYYDCKAGEEAEKFARRCLDKINELKQLEMMSSTNDMVASELFFRSATVKMAAMIFKRTVIETRRRPKGILRPLTRANLKEALSLPWPRTQTEKLLADMFDGGSAQFLGILESLNNSNRRIFQTSPPALDSEPEILDVFCELMMAAQEILAGGGGNHTPGTKSQMMMRAPALSQMVMKGSLFEMAARGEENIPLDSVIHLLKLAYSYEQWDIFEALLGPVLNQIKESKDEKYLWDEKALALLSAVGKFIRGQKRQTTSAEEEGTQRTSQATSAPRKHLKTSTSNKAAALKTVSENEKAEALQSPQKDIVAKSTPGDDLVCIADVLMNIVTGSYQQSKIELDLVVDATLFLWSKCKLVFQRSQTGSVDNGRFLQKMENPSKRNNSEQTASYDEDPAREKEMWTYILETVYQAVSWSGISSVDPALAAEVVLRLAMLYEGVAQSDVTGCETAADSNQNANGLPTGSGISSRFKLIQARTVLDLGLKSLSSAHRAMALNDGKSIADVIWVKDFNPDIFSADLSQEMKEEDHAQETNPDMLMLNSRKASASAMWNTVRDLHLEMILVYHRVCLKLAALGPDKAQVTGRGGTKLCRANQEDEPEADNYVEDFSELCNRCNKNYLSKALLLTQKAVMLKTNGAPSQEQVKLIEDAAGFIQRVQADEKKIYADNTGVNELNPPPSKVPPAPILLCRTDTFAVFKPAPFKPASEEKVAWYRIFARHGSGANLKARLSDNHFPGTGEQVPAFHCELRVSGLAPNERYVYAVAAYTAEGKLIGDGVGETTKPILAFHPLSVLMTWAFVSQMAYQTGCYGIASQACLVMWDHFVVTPQLSPSLMYITEAKKDLKLVGLRLNKKAVSLESPILLRQFLTSIFISTDIAIRKGQLFCDIIFDRNAIYDCQVRRLSLCEFMLIAVELAGWLNEANLALQAVVQIYGLLAPLLYHKVPSLPAIQILQRCLPVLQEIPSGLIQKRQRAITDSLRHMIACITYHMAKTLRTWGQTSLANSIVESGRKMLVAEPDVPPPEEDNKKIPVNVKKPLGKVEAADLQMNDELRALEEHMQSITKSAETELSGTENPAILFSYIATLASPAAFKEVVKFKKKPGYLEYLVHVAQTGLNEGVADQVVQWCDDGFTYLSMRIENILAPRVFLNNQLGDDSKKYSASMVSYSKASVNKSGSRKTSQTTKLSGVNENTSASKPAKKPQESDELKALNTVTLLLLDKFRWKTRRLRVRKMTVDEMPWRSQLNIIQGLSHCSVFLQKLNRREKMLGSLGIWGNRTNFLDPEWFTLGTSGVIIVGWEGGPSKQAQSAAGKSQDPLLTEPTSYTMPQNTTAEKQKMTGIELAAMAATGVAPLPDNAAQPAGPPATVQEDPPPLTAAAATETLKKIFTCFKRAAVLAHRGCHWALLQNAGRALWNCTHTTLLRTLAPANQKGGNTGLLTMDALQSLMWQPFFVTTDCLLDMMIVLQESLDKKQAAKAEEKDETPGTCFKAWGRGIQSEQGGAGLKFDSLLDDTNIIDARWICRMVFRTLELLYLEQKWEKLVDIAMRFSVLTNHRYAERVIPLMVQGQRFLKKRIKQVGGPAPPQRHFKILEAQLDRPIQLKDYLKAQLQVQMEFKSISNTQIDPLGHGMYTKEDAYRLSCVPVNVNLSLAELRETLAQAHYSARALQHSRKLLCLYLAGQHSLQAGPLESKTSGVDFQLNTSQPQPTMPPSKLTIDFSNVNDVQISPLPQSQLGTVISSYENTIDLLIAKNQKGLAAQAMHELGNIFFHAKNSKTAYKLWCSSLDLIFNMEDALHQWHSVFEKSSDNSAALLEKCGLWGCLLAGVQASNIAQYILTDEVGPRMDSCFLSGYLFKAVFRSSLPHPLADHDYAVYDVGEGCNVTNLIPGIDLMSDRFRCDGRQLVAALKWVTEELAHSHHYLFVLPLLTFYQYLATFVCRDLQLAVEGRVLKVRVLTDLGLYSEAMMVLQDLLNGKCLPQAEDSHFCRMEQSGNALNFIAEKPVTDPGNLKVIEVLLRKRLPSNLSTLFGPHLTCHLILAQAHLFISLASTIPVLPKIEGALPQVQLDPVTVTGGKGAVAPSKNPAPPLTTSNSNVPPTREVNAMEPPSFTDGSRTFSLEQIKAIILDATHQMVTTLVDIIVNNATKEQQGMDSMSAAELELVVQCRLEQARIAQQKHHAPMAARIILAALNLIQNSQIFKKYTPKKPKPPPSRLLPLKGGETSPSRKQRVDVSSSQPVNAQFQYQNFQARRRLDVRLWLQCRLELVKNLMMEVHGMGDIIDPEQKAVSDLADCRQYCAEGLGEAEVCGDREMQAQFLALGAQLNIIEGKSLEHTVSLLEDALKILNLMHHRPVSAELLLVSCIVLKADLEAVAGRPDSQSDSVTQKTLSAYVSAQKIVLHQLELLGEKIEHYYSEGELDCLSSPVSPIKNVYLPHIQRLVQIKLRIGHAKARNTAKMIRNGNPAGKLEQMWGDCLGILTTALEMSQISALREASTEAEILLIMGRVQKMLVFLDCCQADAAANTLLKAIKTSFINDHDLGLMRQAYLEIALIYLYTAGLITVKDSLFMEPVVPEKSLEPNRDSSKTDSKNMANVSFKKSDMMEKNTEMGKETNAAWLAIRCAAAVANAQRARKLLLGDQVVVSQKIEDKMKDKFDMPDFVFLDLLSDSILGEKKKTYKNDIEEELAPLTEAQEVKIKVIYTDQINKVKAAAKELRWIYCLGYQTILQRLQNTSTLSVSTQRPVCSRQNDKEDKEKSGNEELDLGFISHAQFDTSVNYDVVRYMLHSGLWSVRLTDLHSFLTKNLEIYAAGCCAPYPPAELYLPKQAPLTTEVTIPMKSYALNLGLSFEQNTKPDNDVESTPPKTPLPPGSNVDPYKPMNKISVPSPEGDMSVQWYQPGLEEVDLAHCTSSVANKQIILLYAGSKQEPQDPPSLITGFKWVSLPKVNNLHDRLALLVQIAEVSLTEKDHNKKATSVAPSPTFSRIRRTTLKIKDLSSKAQQQEQLERLLKQCIKEAHAITVGSPVEQASTEFPFDMTKVNIKNMESVFDPSLGMTLIGTDLLPWLLELLDLSYP